MAVNADTTTLIEPDHPEYTCERCGGRNVAWFVDSDRFNMAVNRGEIICPVCFVLAHETATGMSCSWELRPASPFRWIEDEGRPTPFLASAVAEGDAAREDAAKWRQLQQTTVAFSRNIVAEKVAERDAATRQLAEAREAIENAPHATGLCPTTLAPWAECICWKSRALAALDTPSSTGGG